MRHPAHEWDAFFMDFNFWTDQEVLDVTQEVVDRWLLPKFRDLNMRASGEWEASLEVKRTGINESAIFGRPYTEFLTKGRSPNANQDPQALRRWAVWAGSTFIKKWVQDKGLDLDPIGVAYNIAKHGTTWKHKGGSDLLEVLQSPEVLDFIRAKLATIASTRIAEQMRRDAQNIFN